MKKELLIIASILLLASIIFSIVMAYQTPKPSPKLKTCENLVYNPGGINILFFADKKTTQNYADYFYEHEPFKENKNAFNFYYIDYEPDCGLYQGQAILCNSREISTLAASCPNDYIAVIKKQPSSIRSSAYTNIMSLNYNHPKSVFLHEFGHVFANFAEEYITSQQLPRGSKNCVLNCENFQNLNQDCEKGCTQESMFRSIKDGIMRTLSSDDYGNFNKYIIQEKITSMIPITAQAIQEQVDCNQERYYLVQAILENSTIKILNTTIEIGCYSNYDSGGFSYTISGDFELTKNFNPEFIFTDAPGEIQISGETYPGGIFYLKIPIITNPKSIKIQSDMPLAEINLQEIKNKPCKK